MLMTDDDPVSLDGKRAVVIGGTSGIGEAIALGFAAEGADVVASSRDATRVAAVATRLREFGTDTIEVPCDVTDDASVRELCDTVVERFGGVDVLVTSQGTAARQRVLDLDVDEWNRVVDVLLTGTFRACRTFGARMDTGSIVTVSSIAAGQARSGLAPYAASKAGVEALTRVLAAEFAPEIRVNALAPGFVITPLTADAYAESTPEREKIEERTPMGRVAAREEMVGAATYLASDASSYTTGSILRVDGGFRDAAL
jgi:NAD(P)-dependent dehydrogenase (short-subunit alcohol dehydrogenase family)